MASNLKAVSNLYFDTISVLLGMPKPNGTRIRLSAHTKNDRSSRITKHIDQKGSALLRCAPTLELQRKRKLRESKDIVLRTAD